MITFLYGLSGVLLALLFQLIDRYFSRHIFSRETLIIGWFVDRHPFVSSLFPFTLSLILTLILKSHSIIAYILPGLVCAFCIVWPKIYTPEILPDEVARRRTKLFFLFMWLIMVFSIFSYVGGSIGNRYVTDFYPVGIDRTTHFITWTFIGTTLLVLKRHLKLQ